MKVYTRSGAEFRYPMDVADEYELLEQFAAEGAITHEAPSGQVWYHPMTSVDCITFEPVRDGQG
jgi:hypothetical protein